MVRQRKKSTKVPVGKKHNAIVTRLLCVFFSNLMKELTLKELCDAIPYTYDMAKTQKEFNIELGGVITEPKLFLMNEGLILYFFKA